MGILSSSRSSTTNRTSTELTDARVLGGDGIAAGQGATVTVQSDRALELAENAVLGILKNEAKRGQGELANLSETLASRTIPALAVMVGLYLILRR